MAGWRTWAGALVLVVSMAAGMLAPSPAVARAGIRLSEAQAFGAPAGGKGGITNPVAYCPNFNRSPRMRWVLTNDETGKVRTFRWKGSYPGYYFPRVDVGSYTSHVVATCGTRRKSATESLYVQQKKARTTISRDEYRKIHRGMSVRRVARIVGYNGRDPFSYGGKTTRIYDMMPFWRWALVTYRDGRVVSKTWDVDHD